MKKILILEDNPAMLEHLRNIVEEVEPDNAVCAFTNTKDAYQCAMERMIDYAESIEHIMHIHTKQGDILKIPYITIKKLMDELDITTFIQCSRNTVVNEKFVHNVDIPNRVIQLKGRLGRVEIGVMFKKSIQECFS